MNEPNKLLNKNPSPTKTWIHSDDKMQDGIIYNYVGRIGINESMKSLNFETRTQVARESIRRVAECAKLLVIPRRNRKQNEEQLNRILNATCNTDYTGLNVALQINVQCLKVTYNESNERFLRHTMQNISFACGGDADIQDFVAYVAKDEEHGRACYVFECPGGLANNVITTIGHAFELRFKNFLSSNLQQNNNTSNSDNLSNNTNNISNGNSNSGFVSPNKMKFMANGSTDQQNNHFDNLANGSLASTSTLAKVPQSENNGNDNINVPIKKFNPNSEQVITPNGVLANHTNKNEFHAKNIINNGSLRIDEKLEKMRWFHGLLTRDSAEKVLVKDGDYLVRETNKAERQYVLSGRYKGECRHIFLVDPSGVVRTKDRVFDNICHLIQYHQDNNIPIISKDNELLLENPVFKQF